MIKLKNNIFYIHYKKLKNIKHIHFNKQYTNIYINTYKNGNF